MQISARRGYLVQVVSSIRQATNLNVDERSEVCQGIVAIHQPVLQLVMDACESDDSCPETLQPAMDYFEGLKKTPGGEADADNASCIIMTASAMLQSREVCRKLQALATDNTDARDIVAGVVVLGTCIMSLQKQAVRKGGGVGFSRVTMNRVCVLSLRMASG